MNSRTSIFKSYTQKAKRRWIRQKMNVSSSLTRQNFIPCGKCSKCRKQDLNLNLAHYPGTLAGESYIYFCCFHVCIICALIIVPVYSKPISAECIFSCASGCKLA
jgi:hypothetical protein